VFDVLTWSGDSATRTLTGLGFTNNVGLAWVKNRSSAINHVLQDAVRGFTTGKKLSSNLTDSEGLVGNLDDSYGYISGASATGFTIGKSGAGQDWVQMNASGSTYVGWAWDAGTSTVSNTQGSITSQVRANPTAGFSVVKYTTVGSTNSTVGHGLGVAPRLLIVRYINQTSGWFTYHADAGAGNYLQLQTTGAASALSSLWNNTTPTSTVFSIGTAWTSSVDTIAYCFSPVVGYSAMGSYVGNGSSDGPMVWTGMRPRFLMIKRSDTGSGGNYDWMIYDTARDTYNLSIKKLTPNSSISEGQDSDGGATDKFIDILSNGFKIRVPNLGINGSGGTFIYAAFAEMPFNYSRAR
jgi:hypothetical protein